MPGYSEFYFNVDHGYLEGLVRGFKAGILKASDYVNLAQCETLEGKLGYNEVQCCGFGIYLSSHFCTVHLPQKVMLGTVQ